MNNLYFTDLDLTLIKNLQRQALPFTSHPVCLWVCRSGAELCSALALRDCKNLCAPGKSTHEAGFASRQLAWLICLGFALSYSCVKALSRRSFGSNNSIAYALWKALLKAKMWKWELVLPSGFRELSMKRVPCQNSPYLEILRKPKLFFMSVNMDLWTWDVWNTVVKEFENNSSGLEAKALSASILSLHTWIIRDGDGSFFLGHHMAGLHFKWNEWGGFLCLLFPSRLLN